jgi:hypothetical protein
MEIYIARNRAIISQYSRKELQAKIASGEISTKDFAWHEGLPDWVPLGSISATLNEPKVVVIDEAGSSANETAPDETKPKKKVLRHDWRSEPATDKQKDYLESFGIAVIEGLTKGDASELIDRAKAAPAALETQQKIREAKYAEQRRIQAQYPSYHLKEMIASAVKDLEETKKAKREAKALLTKKNKELAAAQQKRASATDEFDQITLNDEIKDIEQEAGEAEEHFDRTSVEEAKSDLKYYTALRIKFWTTTFSYAGIGALSPEDTDGLLDYTETLDRLYNEFGSHFKIPANAQILEVVHALDQQVPDWDKTQPEQFYSALAALFPDLLRKGRVHQQQGMPRVGCLVIITGGFMIYYLLVHFG